MSMSVHLDEKKTFGEISFSGSSGSVCYKSTLHVDFTWEGTRVLSHQVKLDTDMQCANTLYQCAEGMLEHDNFEGQIGLFPTAQDSYQPGSSFKCPFTMMDYESEEKYCAQWDYSQYCYGNAVLNMNIYPRMYM